MTWQVLREVTTLSSGVSRVVCVLAAVPARGAYYETTPCLLACSFKYTIFVYQIDFPRLQVLLVHKTFGLACFARLGCVYCREGTCHESVLRRPGRLGVLLSR